MSLPCVTHLYEQTSSQLNLSQKPSHPSLRPAGPSTPYLLLWSSGVSIKNLQQSEASVICILLLLLDFPLPWVCVVWRSEPWSNIQPQSQGGTTEACSQYRLHCTRLAPKLDPPSARFLLSLLRLDTISLLLSPLLRLFVSCHWSQVHELPQLDSARRNGRKILLTISRAALS